jgi:hypothetical protein
MITKPTAITCTVGDATRERDRSRPGSVSSNRRSQLVAAKAESLVSVRPTTWEERK